MLQRVLDSSFPALRQPTLNTVQDVTNMTPDGLLSFTRNLYHFCLGRLSQRGTSFLRLPNETILHILGFLDVPDLYPVALVCRQLHPLARRAYEDWYGSDLYHEICDPINFPRLAIQQHRHLTSIGTAWYPLEKLLSDLLDCYASDNQEVSGTVAHSLMELRRHPNRGDPLWNEAVATALMAQGQHSLANEYYMRLVDTNMPLQERTILTAARWSWPFDIKLPTPDSPELLKKACVGAAAGGNLEYLQACLETGVGLDVVVDRISLASAAASTGQVHILQFLHDRKVDLKDQGSKKHPLFEAARCGQLAAVKFLLEEVGAQPDRIETAVDAASMAANVAILRLFLEYMPTLQQNSHSSNGKLRVASAISEEQVDSLTFFIKEASIGIDEVDGQGRTALHLAVDGAEKKNLIDTIVALGADVDKLDISGQTAFERAASRDKPAASWLAQHVANCPLGLKAYTMLRARSIVISSRRVWIQLLAARYGREGRDLEETMEAMHKKWTTGGIDDKLIAVWICHMSAIALDWYVKDIMGSAADETLQHVLMLPGLMLTPVPPINKCHSARSRKIVAATAPYLSNSHIINGEETSDRNQINVSFAPSLLLET